MLSDSIFHIIFSQTALIFYLLAYLLGSINFAIIFAKIFHLPSPRTLGSGNPGATNMLRTGSKKAAALTLIFDLLKSLLIVIIAKLSHEPLIVTATTGLAALIGHIFPIFFRFKGGKGVATLIGSLLGFAPILGFCFVIIWGLTLALTKISSLSALISSVLVLAMSYFYYFSYFQPAFYPKIETLENITELKAVFYIILVMILLVLFRHHGNIKRLILGQEK